MKNNEISYFLKKQVQNFWTITSKEELIIDKYIEPAINSMLSIISIIYIYMRFLNLQIS